MNQAIINFSEKIDFYPLEQKKIISFAIHHNIQQNQKISRHEFIQKFILEKNCRTRNRIIKNFQNKE